MNHSWWDCIVACLPFYSVKPGSWISQHKQFQCTVQSLKPDMGHDWIRTCNIHYSIVYVDCHRRRTLNIFAVAFKSTQIYVALYTLYISIATTPTSQKLNVNVEYNWEMIAFPSCQNIQDCRSSISYTDDSIPIHVKTRVCVDWQFGILWQDGNKPFPVAVRGQRGYDLLLMLLEYVRFIFDIVHRSL